MFVNVLWDESAQNAGNDTQALLHLSIKKNTIAQRNKLLQSLVGLLEAQEVVVDYSIPHFPYFPLFS
jgi:hypothetical protein